MAERTHDYCMAKIRPLGVVCDSQYLYYQNARQITVDKINEGRALVMYSGHGDEDQVGREQPGLRRNATTHALTNQDKVPFVATFACLTGRYAATASVSPRVGFATAIAARIAQSGVVGRRPTGPKTTPSSAASSTACLIRPTPG